MVHVDNADENVDFAVAAVLAGAAEMGHVGALIFGRKVDAEAGDLDVVDDDGGMEELVPVEDAEAEVVDGDHGFVAVKVVGVELEAVAGNLEAIGEDHMEFGELDAAVEAVAEGLNDFGFEHGAGAVEEDVAGNEGGDGENGEDGGDPEERNDKWVMTAPARGRAYGIDRLSAHSGSLLSIVDRVVDLRWVSFVRDKMGAMGL